MYMWKKQLKQPERTTFNRMKKQQFLLMPTLSHTGPLS